MHESEKVKVKSCLTLSDLMDCSPPGSSIHGILKARVGPPIIVFLWKGKHSLLFNKFQGKEFNPNKSIKFIFEKYPWHEGLCIFAISDISTCDWCGGRDGGCNSLDCYTCDSPWHHFLFSSAIFLRDITRCETPGMYKWVPGLSGWDGSAVYLPFMPQLTRPLKLCRLFYGISHC